MLIGPTRLPVELQSGENRLGRSQNRAWRDFSGALHFPLIPSSHLPIFHPSTLSTRPKPGRFGHSISEKNPANRNLSARRPASLAPCTVALKIGRVLSSHDPCPSAGAPGQIRSMRNPLWPNPSVQTAPSKSSGYPVVQPSKSPRAGVGTASYSSCANLLNPSRHDPRGGPTLGDPEIWRGERMERMRYLTLFPLGDSS